MTTLPPTNAAPGSEGQPPARSAAEERSGQNPLPQPPPGATGERPRLVDEWIAIEPNGTITAFSGKVELGTGVRTALAQIVAEELDVPVERVRMLMGDTELTPDEGFTAGSMTIRVGGSALRQAAAEARQALLEMASDRLDAAVEELAVDDGVVRVVHHPDRTIAYAELMGGRRFKRAVSGRAPLKAPAAYRVVGTALARVDLPSKVSGEPSFVQDLRLPGMLHGRVVAPPGPGAVLVSVDPASVESLPGVVQVVRRGSFVAVIAEREEQAIRAAQALRVEWRETAKLGNSDDLPAWMRAQPVQDEVLAATGDLEAAWQGAAQRLEAAYFQPYHSHASLGPACGVADVRADGVMVWSSTQGAHSLRGALAELLGQPAERVHVRYLEGAGGYGHNGSDDAAAEAALLSQAVGRPVRVQWSRETDFAWEPKAAPMAIEVRGGLDAQGNIAAWDYHVWTPPHSTRPRRAAMLLAAEWAAQAEAAYAPGPPRFNGGGRNAVTRYDLANQRVSVHWLTAAPLRASSFRSLGGAANTFANESFMDELAAAAGADPIDFRLRHLSDPRARDVLTAAAERAGWVARHVTVPAGGTRARAGMVEGRGVAFAQYKTSDAYVAAIADVAVDTSTGAVRVRRITVAHDCGLIINPDGVRNQVEGNVIQSLSRALKEEVRYDGARVVTRDWESYPILTFSDVPEVDVVLLNRPDQPPMGAGEPATITTAPAVANAIFDATGARVRRLPLTPERVRAALNA